MKTAVVQKFKEPLVIEDRDVPTPGPRQVLVRLEASGVCHTDIHAAQGDWPVTPTVPFVPGHEGIGIVEAVGEGVSVTMVRQRVSIAWLGSACGHCDACRAGQETLCLQQQNTGYSIDGGYAQYAITHSDCFVPVPDGVDPVEAAPLTCAGVTTYKAVQVANVRPTDVVLISGIGGLAISLCSTRRFSAVLRWPSMSPTTSWSWLGGWAPMSFSTRGPPTWPLRWPSLAVLTSPSGWP